MTRTDQDWYADAIVYTVCVPSFFDGNDDGVGDVVGLMTKLEYLEDLGVTCVCLKPAADLRHPRRPRQVRQAALGTPEECRAFVDAAHRRGIRVLQGVRSEDISRDGPPSWLDADFDGVVDYGESAGALRERYAWKRLFVLADGVPVPLEWLAQPGTWRRPTRERLRAAWEAALRFGDTGPLSAWLRGWRRGGGVSYGVPAEPCDQDPLRVEHAGGSDRLSALACDGLPPALLGGLRFSLPGPAVIDYGEEIGLCETPAGGPAWRALPLMQWSDDRCGGFSSVEPRFTMPNDDPRHGFRVLNVRSQRESDESLFHATRAWFSLRARSEALRRGDLEVLDTCRLPVVSYVRESGSESVLVVLNCSGFALPVPLNLPARFRGRAVRETTSGLEWPAIGGGTYQLTLPPYTCWWLQLEAAKRGCGCDRPIIDPAVIAA